MMVPKTCRPNCMLKCEWNLDIGWHGVLATLNSERVDIQHIYFVYNLIDLLLKDGRDT